MRYRWLAIAFSLPVFLGCASNNPPWGKVEANSTDEVTEVRAINKQVWTAMSKKDFDALNALAEEFRTRRSRSPSGTWKLSWFYRAFSLGLPIEKEGGGCVDNRESFISDWIKATPNEPTPYIAKAEAFIALGACFRSGGWSREVSSDAFAELARDIAKANEVLEAVWKIGGGGIPLGVGL